MTEPTDTLRTDKPTLAIENLTNHQTQADENGVIVKVSRQALDEVLEYLATPTPLPDAIERARAAYRKWEAKSAETRLYSPTKKTYFEAGFFAALSTEPQPDAPEPR